MKFNDTPIPAHAGVGLKPQHYDDILGNDNQDGSSVAWFEVHPENYFAQGGLSHRALRPGSYLAIADNLLLERADQ